MFMAGLLLTLIVFVCIPVLIVVFALAWSVSPILAIAGTFLFLWLTVAAIPK